MTIDSFDSINWCTVHFSVYHQHHFHLILKIRIATFQIISYFVRLHVMARQNAMHSSFYSFT